MRYKVQAQDGSAYREILSALAGRVRVYTASEERLLLSTGDLTEDCRKEIAARGGQVSSDFRYEPGLEV